MTTYAIAETNHHGNIVADNWKATKATTLAAAKRVAQAARLFQGTDAHVGIVRDDGSVALEATRRNGVWIPVGAPRALAAAEDAYWSGVR